MPTGATSRRVTGVAAYVGAVVSPAALTALILATPAWPKPYSWQYLGLTIVLAVLTGVGPGLVALAVSFAAVIWLRVPTPVHPGAEMFVAIGLCLLALLQRWRLTEGELRRQAEVVRESTMLLRAISDESADVIFAKDLEGRIRFANPATFALIGKPAERVLGRTDVEFLDDKDAARRVMENDRQVMASGMATEVEELIPSADGTERMWLSRKSPYRDAAGHVIGLLGISRDITSRKRANAALLESEHRYREIAEALTVEREKLASVIRVLPVGVVIGDVHGTTLSMNEAGLNVHGFASESEMLAQLPDYVRRFDLLEVDGRPLPAADWPAARAMRGEFVNRTELRLRNRQTGTERIVSYSVLPVRNGAGDPVLFLYVIDDITDQKQAEAALHDANEQLRDANYRKTEFIAVLSHELRNPLAPIRYAIPLIEQTEPSGPAARALQVIRRQVDHLTRLVDDLLDVSRVTHGAIELCCEEVSLGAILADAAEAASAVMVAARHQFDLIIPEEPVWINADAARLTQVVTNLLNNAAKFTQRGGRIQLSGSIEAGQAIIRVRDNGMGIPRHMLSGIFDMFRQLNRAEDSRHHEGLGIGLGLAKRLVELHGGTIEARSAGPAHGAEFLVRVPLAASPREKAAAAAAPRGSGARPLKVLVVDDNADLLDMLATIVEWEGHEVRKALDGRSAISAALAFRPDVVLLDLGLPFVGGIDVARELRRHQEVATTRIVALTGWGQLEDRESTAAAGFDYHLTKPTDPQTLTALLREYARPRGAGEDATVRPA